MFFWQESKIFSIKIRPLVWADFYVFFYIAGAAMLKPARNRKSPIFATSSLAMCLMWEAEMVLQG